MKIRALVERISRGRVLKRELHTASGRIPIYVSPDAQLKYLKLGKSAFDGDLIKIADGLIGADDNVWDVGANVGVFSFAVSTRTSGEVVAVEADLWLAQLINRTKRKFSQYRNKQIFVLPVAASHSDGLVEFNIAGRGRASNAIAGFGRSQMGGVRETILTPALCLDTLTQNRPAPNFIKIDVEGAELHVLKGAVQTLARHKPTIYSEVSAESFEPCVDLMEKLGYQAVDEQGRPAGYHCRNAFFVHDSRPELPEQISALGIA